MLYDDLSLEVGTGLPHTPRVGGVAVAPTPIRAVKAEALIRGKKLDDNLIKEAARLASDEAKPISDVRSSKEYRNDMVEVLTQRALQQTIAQAVATR
jgi:carbon-monoxide dehydrogenase medium subunit